MSISDEAVEALAAILVEEGAYGVPWGDASTTDRADAIGKARRYLTIAAPHMLAGAWDEGDRTGRSRAMRHMSDEPSLSLVAPNPYRPAK